MMHTKNLAKMMALVFCTYEFAMKHYSFYSVWLRIMINFFVFGGNMNYFPPFVFMYCLHLSGVVESQQRCDGDF